MAGLAGDEQAMGRHLRALERLDDYGPLPDGSRSVESATSQMRAILGFGGPVDMMAAARRAAELETDGRSAQFGIAQAALGHAHYLQGELDQAIPHLRAASRTDRRARDDPHPGPDPRVLRGERAGQRHACT